MQIIRNKNRKKQFLIATIATVVFVGGVTAALFIPSSPFSINKPQEDRSENTTDYNEPTNDQKDAGSQAKEDFIKRQDEAAKNDGNTQGRENGSTDSPVGLTISSAGQSGSTLQIRTIIETLDGNGICSLELTKSGADVVTQQVGTQVLGSYSVCRGFDVPSDGMEKGSWSAKISYKGSNGQSGNVQRTVEVQ